MKPWDTAIQDAYRELEDQRIDAIERRHEAVLNPASESTYNELCLIAGWRTCLSRIRLYLAMLDRREWPADFDRERVRAVCLAALGEAHNGGAE